MHIGRLIREEIRKQDHTVKWFAKKLNCNRTNAYNIFRRANIDTEIMTRICLILNHNFFNDLSAEMDIKLTHLTR